MKAVAFLAIASLVFVGAVPVFEDVYESDEPLAVDELSVPLEGFYRQRRSLPEVDAEETAFGGGPEPSYGLARPKRATCDALSFSSKWLTINHSACAVHCIAKGYKGGKCKNTVCHCRR